MNTKLLDLLPRMKCPECIEAFGMLQKVENYLHCKKCNKTYPILKGVPFLLSSQSTMECGKELTSDTGKSMQDEYHSLALQNSGLSIVKKIINKLKVPGVIYHSNPTLRNPSTAHLFNHQGKETAILNIGGGPHRYSEREITLNIGPFLNVDIVGDAHRIPFAANTFDSIICNAVLEHIYDGNNVVAEMLRVLKPGGFLYAEVPFIFFFHGYPNDFLRYTREGMRRLFAGLESTVFDISGGPTSALLQSIAIYLTLLTPRRYKMIGKAFSALFRLFFFPLKYIDILLNRLPDAHIFASGISVMGRKPVA